MVAPHSSELTIKLSAEVGLQIRIAQVAEDKQIIIDLVAAHLGVASVVAQWASRMTTPSGCYIPFEEAAGTMNRLPLAAGWIRRSHDAMRDEILAMLREGLENRAKQA